MAQHKNPTGGSKIRGLIVERIDLNLTPAESVPVLIDFDQTKYVGTTAIKKTDVALVADLDLFNDEGIAELFPAIGYSVKSYNVVGETRNIESGTIFCLSLSTKPNVDTSIQSVGKQLGL